MGEASEGHQEQSFLFTPFVFRSGSRITALSGQQRGKKEFGGLALCIWVPPLGEDASIQDFSQTSQIPSVSLILSIQPMEWNVMPRYFDQIFMSLLCFRE